MTKNMNVKFLSSVMPSWLSTMLWSSTSSAMNTRYKRACTCVVRGAQQRM